MLELKLEGPEGPQSPGQGWGTSGPATRWGEFIKCLTKQSRLTFKLVILLARERCYTYPHGPGQEKGSPPLA